MKLDRRKYIVSLSIPLEVLTPLTILYPLTGPVYAASAHTSGYNHGCSDAQISIPSDRSSSFQLLGPRLYLDIIGNVEIFDMAALQA